MRDPITGKRFEGLRVIGTLLLCGPGFVLCLYGIKWVVEHVS